MTSDPGSSAGQQANLSPYISYLSRRGLPVDDAQEDVDLRTSDWRYYYQGHFTNRQNATAIDSAGRAVNETELEHWAEFLTQPDVAPRLLADRVVWLLGRAAVVDESIELDAEAAKLAHAPRLVRDKSSGVTFTIWTVFPPIVREPMRLTISAPQSGKATIEYLDWHKVQENQRK